MQKRALELVLAFQWYYMLSNRAVAQILGVDPSTYCNWTRGANNISVKHAKRILEVIPEYVHESFGVALSNIWDAHELRAVCMRIAQALRKQRAKVHNVDLRALLLKGEEDLLIVVRNGKGGDQQTYSFLSNATTAKSASTTEGD